MPALIGITAAIFLFGLFAALLKGLFRDKLAVSSRLRQLSAATQPEPLLRKHTRRESRLPQIPRARLTKLEDELSCANVLLRAEEFIVLWLCCCILIPGLAYFLGAKLVVYGALLAVCAASPIVLVKLNKKKRMSKLDGQLSDALSIMCGALRAGFSFQKAMETIAVEMPEPISREFSRVARECQLGMPMETSFVRLNQRVGSRDLELICSAVLIQRQVGGNLAEVLDNVGETIRQRLKMKGDIKVMTASGTVSGYIIGLLPVFLLLVLSFLSPDYVEMFFTTRQGGLMLLVAGILELMGFLCVKKVVSIKF